MEQIGSDLSLRLEPIFVLRNTFSEILFRKNRNERKNVILKQNRAGKM